MNGRKSSIKEYIFARYLYSMFGTVVGVGHWALRYQNNHGKETLFTASN